MRKKLCVYLLVLAMVMSNMDMTAFATETAVEAERIAEEETLTNESEAVEEKSTVENETVEEETPTDKSEDLNNGNDTDGSEDPEKTEKPNRSESETDNDNSDVSAERETGNDVSETETEGEYANGENYANARDGEIVASGECGENLTWTLVDGTLTISGMGEMESYSERYNNKIYITTAPWGEYYDSLQTLVIDKGVTSIGDYAFYDCRGFTGDLVIPDSVTCIGNSAFYGCSGFTGDLVIPDSVTSIGYSAFEYCSGFTGNLILSKGIKRIGNYAFEYCSGFTGDLVIPDSVTSIGYSAFYGCSGFTGNLIISGSVTSIGQSVFSGCSGFTGDLVIPDSVTSIGQAAFLDCSGFTGDLVIPDSVTNIGKFAFEYCSGFTGDLVISGSVTSIGNETFLGCSGFTGNLVIPNRVTSIGNSAFSGCSGFTGNLVILDSVTSIGFNAFFGCSGFTGDLIIPDSVTYIGEVAFGGCSNLSGKIYIPESVTSIGEYAFSGIPNRAIYGYVGSYAETYANENDIPFYPYNFSRPKKGTIDFANYKNYTHFYVIDAEFNIPIGGAKVNGQTSDDNGHVAIEASEDGEEKLIVVSADGYHSNISVITMKRNGTYYISLNPVDSSFKIVSAKAITSDSTFDLLSGKLYLENTGENVAGLTGKTNLEIEAVARGDVKSYALIQDGQVISSSTDGKFSIPIVVRSGKNSLTNLEAQKTVSIKATDSDGNTTTSKIGLYISPEGAEDIEEEKTGSISIGSSIKIDIPEEIPFLGGPKVNFGLEDALPFDLIVERNGEVKIAINKEKSKSFDRFKEDYDKLSSRAKNLSDAASVFGGTPQSFGGGYLSTKLYVKGYGEGCINMDKPGTYKIKVEILAGGEGNGAYTQYFFAGAIPIYLSVEGGIEASCKVTVSLGQEDSKTTFELGNGQISGEIYIKATTGVGVQKIVDISVSGTGESNYLYKPSKDYTKIWLNAYLEVEADCFGWEFSLWKSPEATYTIYETPDEAFGGGGDGSGIRSADSLQSLQNQYTDITTQIYDVNQYTLMDRSYSQESSAKAIDLNAIPIGAVQSNVYPGASPKLVNVNGTLYLFWLQDIETRSAENRAAVVYATSTDGSIWSEPKQLVTESENQTLDNGVDIFVDGSNIYICWQDAAEVYETGTSLNEAVAKLNISYAVIDAAIGNVISHQTVTSEAGCYMQPTIYAQNGQVQIAWIENDMAGGSLWSVDNNEKLVKYDSASGEISELSIGSGKEKIISMDGAVSGSRMGVAYSLDTDGDLTTIDDRIIYFDSRLGTGESRQALTGTGTNINPVSENGVIYWYSNENISYTTVGSNAVQQIYEEEQYDVGSDFKVVSDSQSTYIIWNAIEYDSEKVAIYGIHSLENGRWSKPYIIERTDSEMTGVISGSFKDGALFISYLNKKNADDGSKNCSVCVTGKKDATDIALNYAGYEYDDFKLGQTLPITAEITNKGNTAVYSVIVKWDGSELGTENIDLGVGETKTITINQYTVPLDVNSFAQHTLSVAAVAESDGSDNDYSIGIGYTDMKVICSQRLQNENTWFDISVINDSSIASGAVLNIRADRADGKIVYTEDLGTIDGGKGVSLTVNMRRYENTYCTYFVEVVTDVEDVIEGNNIEFVYTGYGTDIKSGDLIGEPKTYLVTFNSNGGSYVGNERVEESMSVSEPQPPTREGYHFTGWYLNGELYDFYTPVNSDITLEAGWKEYEVLVSPSASVKPGMVAKGTKVSLTCAASGVVIYYTLDGSEPTLQSMSFTEPIEIVSDTTIKAFAVKEGFKGSAVVTFVYTIDTDKDPENPDNPNDDPDNPDNDNPDNPDDSDDDTEGVLPNDIPEGGIPSGLWIAGVSDAIYTGTAIKPQVRVYDGEIRLVQGTDYTISYKNNIMANNASDEKKAPTVVVKGKGNYSGTETATFKILPIDLSDESIIADEIITSYTNKVQKKVPTVTYNNKKLSNGKDFTVTYPAIEQGVPDAYKAAATYDIIITAKESGNFTGTRTIKHTITNSVLISGATVRKPANQTYTGNALEPELTVSYKKTALAKGTDYTVTYQNNIEIGIATAVITGIGDYAGTKKVTFKIVGKSIKGAKVNGIESSVYDGMAKSPKPNIVINNTQLTEGIDYNITYQNNINVGKATIVISGINGYSGSIKKNFKITAYDLNIDLQNKITGLSGTITAKYAKGGSRPVPKLSFNGTKLIAGKDYTVSYKNNKTVTTDTTPQMPTMTIKGKGNFKGTLNQIFTITTKALDDADSPVTLSVADIGFINKAGKYISKPILTDTDGKKLAAGKDYEVIYTLSDGTALTKDDKVNADTEISIKVTGKGAYTGTLEKTYRVTKNSFNNAKISITPQVYTGKAITLDTAAVTVKIGSDTLEYGTDYEIVSNSYSNNIKKGTAGVTIVGKGNYGGTKQVKFKITSQKLLWFWRLFS